jgi:cytochrome c553
MKTRSLWTLWTLGLSLALTGFDAGAAGDREAGKIKFNTCRGCHSIEGYSNVYPSYQVPHLGGQHPDYVVAALKAYQEGERKHGTMSGNATMNEQDMQDIATYVAGFRSITVDLPVTGNVEAGKQKAGVCAGCHGEDGNSEDPNYPRLAGQYESYLIKALRDYKSGARKNPIMGSFAAGLSEQDMTDLAAYYASQKRGVTIVKD